MSDTADQALRAYKEGNLGLAGQLAAKGTDAESKGILGLTHAKRQRIKDAAQALSEAIEAGARNEELPGALVYAYGRLNGPDAMLDHLKRLLAARPEYTSLRLELAQYLYRAERFEEELAACKEGIEVGDTDPALRLFYGRALLNNDQPEAAIKVVEQYTKDVPGGADGFYFLGAALRSVGRIQDAREAFLEAMKLHPFHPNAFYSYMRSGRVREDEPLIKRFDQLAVLLRGASDTEASFYNYGMGKALEDLGRFDEAWKNYERGGIRLSKISRYDPVETEKQFATIKAHFSKERLSSLTGVGNPDVRPIFIVGMPRSGSTLAEQILAGHSQVEALGELLFLERGFRPWLDQLLLGNEVRIPWKALGNEYLASVRGLAKSQSARLIDKGLHNFSLIGLIHLIFPNAVILHCVRDPMDTCFSNFSLRFARGHEWSNRLADAAHYYRQYRDLMAHWNEVLPGRVTDVRYEDLATDFEPQARRLVDACGLPWDPNCLTFYDTERSVRTASSAQVREPVSTSSIGRWKNFATHLAPLESALADFL